VNSLWPYSDQIFFCLPATLPFFPVKKSVHFSAIKGEGFLKFFEGSGQKKIFKVWVAYQP